MTRRIPFHVIIPLLLCASLPFCAQSRQGAHEFRIGYGRVSAQGNTGEVDMKDSSALTLDYTHFYTRRVSWAIDYFHTSMDARSPSPVFPGAATSRSIPIHSFTFALQYHFMPGSEISPYVGFGANFMFGRSSSSKYLVMSRRLGGYQIVAPAGGVRLGTAFQGGVTWTMRNAFVLDLQASYLDNGIKVDHLEPHGHPVLFYTSAGHETLRVKPLVLSLSVGFRW
jgi:outer membrane protein W